MKKLPVLLTIMAFPLSGCAMQQGDFPSLQKRPYESEPVIDEPEASVAVLTSLPAAMRSKLDGAVAQSRSAHQQFLARLPTVESRVDAARGAAVSSESWVVAHMELAALEVQRSPSVEALADIDALYREQLEREITEDQSGGTRIIAEEREAVKVQVDRQQSAIEAMKDRLR